MSSHYDHSQDQSVPVFVETDYNIDSTTGTPQSKDFPPDTCGIRCKSEWRYPWFSVQEGAKTIDVPASFGPSSLSARLIKFGMMVWFLATLIYKWWTKRSNPAFFLAWLTNWAMIFATLWLIVTFGNSMVPPAQPRRPSDPVSLRVKVSWILFTLAAHCTLIVLLLYWGLDYEPGVSTMDYINVFTHVAVVLIWPVGLAVDRYPIRWKHLAVPMLFSSCYVAWLAIHQMLTDIGVPDRSDNDPETNDDLLYTAVDFEETPAFSSILVVCVVFVITPLMHLLLWGLSLWSCPCSCSGKSRRYVLEYASDRKGNGGSAPMSNFNIYEDP